MDAVNIGFITENKARTDLRVCRRMASKLHKAARLQISFRVNSHVSSE